MRFKSDRQRKFVMARITTGDCRIRANRNPVVRVKHQPTTLPKKKMASELREFFRKENKSLLKSFDERDVLPIVDDKPWGDYGKETFHIRTDSMSYDRYFAPDMSEENYLLKEAYDENKVPKSKRKYPDPYRHQSKMGKFLNDRGWDFEPYGQGVLVVFKK